MKGQTVVRGTEIFALGLAALCAAFVTAPAAAADDSIDPPALGGVVEQACLQSGKDSALLCLAYLRGTLDGLLYGQMDATGGMASFCPPSDGIGLGETKAIFLDLLQDEPDRRTEEASLVLLDALEQHFPCADDGDDGDTAALPARDTARHFHRHLTPVSFVKHGSDASRTR